jgi:flavin reductase (DIM6/NTAB) family NADH-FMN oxidoreductase RutF
MIIDPAKIARKERYKLLIGTIVPRPIALVSTVGKNGIYNLAPFSYFTAASTEPATIVFVPNRNPGDGSNKDTLQNIIDTGEFVVNTVSREIISPVNHAATDFPPEVDEFTETGLTPTASEKVRPPRVKEAKAALECKLYKLVDIGNDGIGGATLVVGEVLLFHFADDLVSDNRVDIKKLQPVSRLAGFDYANIGEIFSLPRIDYDPNKR